ncbi:hypothetical protein GCM10010207_79080 [Streptomyces atratus]|uniref:hypothetical protein n=1 Tax=Streptomyces atratus TaxID=1893 RepID=UPI0016708EDA|nr:hypothetical protein [Streptomyces atratus]GGT68558.1 hypothetical protein GCM10010207_79080 [Streptomyces atratus]
MRRRRRARGARSGPRRIAGKSPSVASLYRALAEAGAAAVDDGLPLRPKPTRIRQPEDPLTAEEVELRERLQAQPHPNAETRS